MWVGALVEDIHRPIVLVTPEGKEEEAVMRLARVGYDKCIGYLKGGVQAWKEAGKQVNTIASADAEVVEQNFHTIHLLDVRKPSEYEAEHIEHVEFIPLDFLTERFAELDKNKMYHVHCAGGYRSVIAISLLMQQGYTNLVDVTGGFAALKKKQRFP